MARVFDGRMGVEYGQAMFHAGGGDDTDGDLDGYFAGQLNGMLGAAVPGYIHIMTATHTGEVPFVVEVLDSEPPVDDSYEDIAEVLGCSVSATKSLIHRGREALKERLKPYLRTGQWNNPE